MGIQIGALGVMAPNRRNDLAILVWRALFAGTAASLLNACVAGTLLSLDETIPGAVNATTTLRSLI
jgi:CNT family concentrative nucleoside transporter